MAQNSLIEKSKNLDLLDELPKGQSLLSGLLSNIKENLEESNLSYKVDLVKIDNVAKSYLEVILNDRVKLKKNLKIKN